MNNNYQQQQEPNYKEGEVHIKSSGKQANHDPNVLDVEDVDFEEVD